MKKLILKLWVINLLITIVLFVIHIYIICQSNYSDDFTFLQKVSFIFNVVVSTWFSVLSVIIWSIGSLLFFLNLIEKIRNNYFLSLLTFLGIPTICLIYLLVIVIGTGFEFNKTNFVSTTIYIFLTLIEFLWFRKKIKIHELYKEKLAVGKTSII